MPNYVVVIDLLDDLDDPKYESLRNSNLSPLVMELTSETVWLLNSPMDAKSLFDRLREFLHEGDHLILLPVDANVPTFSYAQAGATALLEKILKTP